MLRELDEESRAIGIVAGAEEGDVGGERRVARRGDDVAIAGEREVASIVAERAPVVDEGGEPEPRRDPGDGRDVADVSTRRDVREPLRVAVPHRVLPVLHQRGNGLELEAERLREEDEVRTEGAGAQAHPALRSAAAHGTGEGAVVEDERAVAGAAEGAGEAALDPPAATAADYEDPHRCLTRAALTLGITAAAARGNPFYTDRMFIAMLAGGCYLGEGGRDADRMLADGEHCIWYESLDDCIARAKMYLADDAARERIRAAGERFVREHHTYDQRVGHFLTGDPYVTPR